MIVYYDGLCALCNGFVRWALKYDRRRRLFFAPLDSRRGERLRDRFPETRGVDSIVLEKDAAVYVRSDAVLEIADALGGVWRAVALGRVVPRALRDRLYDFIARRRYRWFGRLDACPLPPPETREQFYES